MKTLTVSVDEETYRRASMKAAALHVSIADVFRTVLAEFAADGHARDGAPLAQAEPGAPLEQRSLALSAEDFAQFAETLDRAPPAGVALKALLAKKPLWEK